MIWTMFITGTDTDVGKTIATGLIAKMLHAENKSVITQKWVQTGTATYPMDLETHQHISGIPTSIYSTYESWCCPYKFMHASSAHLAARLDNCMIDPAVIVDSYIYLKKKFDYVIVEGSGGPMMPITEDLTSLDIVEKLQCEVVLVIANKLGAINHSLLSIQEITRRGLTIKGLIFNNYVDEDPIIQKDNIKIIQTLSNCQVMGIIPKIDDFNVVASWIKC